MIGLIQSYDNNIAFALKKWIFLYKIVINYILPPFFVAIDSYILDYSFAFLFLYYIIIYILSIVSAVKRMTVKELKDFIFKSCHSQIGLTK